MGGGAPLALLGMSSCMSVDDPAGFDPPGVTPGLLPEVTLGSGHNGGGGGGVLVVPRVSADVLLLPRGVSLRGVFLAVLLASISGHSSRGAGIIPAGRQRQAKAIGERLKNKPEMSLV